MLSSEQRTVLTILATGASVAETARMLGWSEQEVRTHTLDAIHRLGVTSKLAAVLLAVRTGQITMPERTDDDPR